MARKRSRFICSSCGTSHPRWSGQCDSCNDWNSIQEQEITYGIGSKDTVKNGKKLELVGLEGSSPEKPRINSQIKELDRVTGGGFVRGSVLLVGGEPGIGKSTILMQAATSLAQAGHKIIYISGEEAISQIRLRAKRLGVSKSHVLLAVETHIETILTTLQNQEKADLVIIDSIQTIWSNGADSTPGTVTQVRLCSQALINYAKNNDVTMILVGHVTKEGQIAGPRVVEHMVDCVLYFEGDNQHHYRLLRGVKNRFGATNEVGVFEMTEYGLKEIANPSSLFLGKIENRSAGSVIFAGIEGTRPILVEIQALVVITASTNVKRSCVGFDNQRLHMILAVLEAHCGIKLSNYDIYINVAGGYKIQDPGADLAVAAAIVSSFSNIILPSRCVYFGEISLSGNLRPVAQANSRIKEAQKLGFNQAVLSADNIDITSNEEFATANINKLQEVVERILARDKIRKQHK
ncbi:DNA repair protein RadA [Bartonella sp. DGB1]|uniref:DNA repair protein RadA n=1 Tax=Bartonella sp. DGB1 TaxID=3239807 RepID=UPI0035242609